MSICFSVVLYHEDKNLLKHTTFHNNTGHTLDHHACTCNSTHIRTVYYTITARDYILYPVLTVRIFITNVTTV